MVPDTEQVERGEGLRIALERPLPSSLPVGTATAVFCFGHCFHPRERVAQLALRVGDRTALPAATEMPRRDLAAWLRATGEDRTGRSYHSGFWGTVQIQTPAEPGVLELQAAVRLRSGTTLVRTLGRIEIVTPEPPADPEHDLLAGTIVVCMATFDPEPALLRVQIESLRAQTDDRWICVISDGGSTPERFAQLLEIVGDDSRFVVSRSPVALDPYRNFERAMRMAPPQAELIALSDQDDRWYPCKLALLREALGSAVLAYCDQRLVAEDGRVIRESLWRGRRNDYRNLASLLVANTMPGAAMLMRRSLLQVALPFPDPPGVHYHDHWLAVAALASGDVSYVDQPLYDYVQHARAVSGHLMDAAAEVRRGRWRMLSGGWRSAYFAGYMGRVIYAQTLMLRCGTVLTRRKRHALEWFVASEHAPLAFLWLVLRPLRALVGRGETLAGEVALARGILWRWLVPVLGARQAREKRGFDASFPDPPSYEQHRLRRWRAGA